MGTTTYCLLVVTAGCPLIVLITIFSFNMYKTLVLPVTVVGVLYIKLLSSYGVNTGFSSLVISSTVTRLEKSTCRLGESSNPPLTPIPSKYCFKIIS